jgi:Putative zinc binding domain
VAVGGYCDNVDTAAHQVATAAREDGPLTSAIPGATSCRACGAELELTMLDLGKSPPCEAFLSVEQTETVEAFYPLHVRVCTSCWLAQLPSFVSPEEIFGEYAYFSAYSSSWVDHAENYVNMTAP